MLATIVVSAASLVGWVAAAKPDIVRHLAMVPALPVWAYPFAGIGFATLNAAMEEAVFRGVIMEALDSAFGAGYRPFRCIALLGGLSERVARVRHGLVIRCHAGRDQKALPGNAWASHYARRRGYVDIFHLGVRPPPPRWWGNPIAGPMTSVSHRKDPPKIRVRLGGIHWDAEEKLGLGRFATT